MWMMIIDAPTEVLKDLRTPLAGEGFKREMDNIYFRSEEGPVLFVTGIQRLSKNYRTLTDQIRSIRLLRVSEITNLGQAII